MRLIIRRNLSAMLLRCEKIFPELFCDRGTVEQGVVLKLQEETSVVEVHRADCYYLSVNDAGLRMQEAGDVFVS